MICPACEHDVCDCTQTGMIWLTRVEWTFARAPYRRHHRRGKRADRRALLDQRMRSAMDALWAPIFVRSHPFLDRPRLGPVDDAALQGGVDFIMGRGWDEGEGKTRVKP